MGAAQGVRRNASTGQRTLRPKPCPCGSAPRKNAPPCRLQPHSGAAAVQRGEKRIQGGSRGNSQSPYPSLAAGGCHAAAIAAKGGARTRHTARNATEERRAAQNSLPLRQSAAQERAAKPANQQKNAKQRKTPLPLRQSAALARAAPPPPLIHPAAHQPHPPRRARAVCCARRRPKARLSPRVCGGGSRGPACPCPL